HGPQSQLPPCPIECDDRALPKTEMMPIPQGQIIDVMRGGIHSSCCDFVQQRLPEMRLEPVDQRDIGAPPGFVAQLVAQRGRLRPPTGATADDDDATPSRRSPLCQSSRPEPLPAAS